MSEKNFDIKSILIFVFLTFNFGVVFGSVIDTMDNLSFWSSQSSEKTLSTPTITTDGYSGNGIMIEYTFPEKFLWTQIYKNFSSSDLSSGDSIALRYKGTGSKNNIEIKLIDSDGDIGTYVLSGVTDTEDWTLRVCRFRNFSLWTDSGGRPFGNGALNVNDLKKISFNITKNAGGSGTVYIDDVTSYISDVTTATIDNCDTRTNSFNVFVSTLVPQTSGTIGYVTLNVESSFPSPKGGSYYKIDYDIKNSPFIIGVLEQFGLSGSTYNASAYKYINFYLKISSATVEPNLEIKDGNNIDVKRAVKDYGGLSTDWKLYTIPLSDFSGIDKTKLKEIKLVFFTGSGVLYVDHFWFSLSTGTTGFVSTIDSMEGPFTNYTTCKDKDATAQLSVHPYGYSGNAMKIDYSFNTGEWIVNERSVGKNTFSGKGFRFKYKGYSLNCNLEFKIKDVNGVEYWKKFSGVTNTDGEWKTVAIPYNDLYLFAANNRGDTSIDFKTIQQISFAISNGDNTGTGRTIIDELEIITDDDFSNTRSGKLLSYVGVENNPFSPDNDGKKDFTRFNVIVSDYSEIVLEVYNLAGEMVYEENFGWKISGVTHTDLVWYGKDKNGVVVRNGLYIYKIKAKSIENRTDSFIHLIGVFR